MTTRSEWFKKLPPLPAGFGPPAGITCRKLDIFLGIYEMVRSGYTAYETSLHYGVTAKYVLNIVSRLRRWTHHPQWYSKVYGKQKAWYKGKPVNGKNKIKTRMIK